MSWAENHPNLEVQALWRWLQQREDPLDDLGSKVAVLFRVAEGLHKDWVKRGDDMHEALGKAHEAEQWEQLAKAREETIEQLYAVRDELQEQVDDLECQVEYPTESAQVEALKQENRSLRYQLRDAEQRITHGVERMTDHATERMNKTVTAENALIRRTASEALRKLQEVLDADFAGAEFLREYELAQGDLERLRQYRDNREVYERQLIEAHKRDLERFEREAETMRHLLVTINGEIDDLREATTKAQAERSIEIIASCVAPYEPENEPW